MGILHICRLFWYGVWLSSVENSFRVFSSSSLHSIIYQYPSHIFCSGPRFLSCIHHASSPGECNPKMHKAFLAAGIIFALDALFVLCNFCYVRRVFSHALDTLEQSQDDALVDEYLVPHAPTIEPMDLRATSVMGALPSCRSTTC